MPSTRRPAAFVFLFAVLSFCGREAPAQDLRLSLGDIAAGGDGTGTADPTFVGINPDTGLLETFHVNAPIQIGDGTALQPIDDAVSEFIDSVFIIDSLSMTINTGGALFEFPAEDLLTPPQTWDHILKDRIGGEDYPAIIGGTTFATSVGIHSAAGITFDLEALRGAHGADAIGEISAFAGMGDSPSCLANPGFATCYIIVSDEVDVLRSASHRTSVGGRQLRVDIPPEAKFLTLASGAGDGRFYCNAGTFGDALLGPLSPIVVSRDLPDFLTAGETVSVALEVAINKPPVAELEVRERLPFSWHALSPSPPGAVETDAGGRETVVWKLTGGVVSQTLTYDLMVPDPYANVRFTGGVVRAGAQELPIFGDDEVSGGSEPNVQQVLIVTMKQPVPDGCTAPNCCAGNDPGEAAQALDYLRDGADLTEQTVVPVAGESVSPDFLGASPSPGPTVANDLTWTVVNAANGWFDLSPCENCLSYVAMYVVNPTAQTLRVRIGSASDDGEQILVDGKEVWNNSVARGAATAQPQDHSSLFDLTPGKHLVLQKVFEGCGGFNSSLRFEDEDSNPLVLLRFTVDPDADKPLAGDPAYPLGRAFVLRTIPASLEAGGTGAISLKLRIKDGALNGATIVENVPAGWDAADISSGGVLSGDVATGRKITWSIAGALANQDLSYRVTVPPGAADALFAGTAVLGGIESAIAGDRLFMRGLMTSTGFIKQWLVLGPLDTLGLWPGDPADPNLTDSLNGPSGTPEGGDLRLDYLSDGTLTEKTLRPFDGMRISPAFNGNGVTGAKSLGLEPLARACAPDVPTWEKVITPGSTFDHDAYFGEPIDSHATYAAAYITNNSGGPLSTNLAFHSDDAFIAFLNGEEVAAYEPSPCSNASCGRGYGAEDEVAGVAPVVLPPGESYLLTRVHDGFGGSGHRLRFQDANGQPLLPGPSTITVSLRSSASPPPVLVRRVIPAPVYSLGSPIEVKLGIESSGAHDVRIREVLPAGWSAAAISDGGSLAGGIITWTLAGVTGAGEVSYQPTPPDCAGSAGFCGNAGGSDFTVDAARTHGIRGDSSLRRDRSGTDPLGPWDARDIGTSGGGTERIGPRAVDVLGRGAGVRQKKDEFRFVSVPATGDFEIQTRIDCIDDPAGSGQLGLMVRDTFDTFSANVFLYLTPSTTGATLRGSMRTETSESASTKVVAFSDREVSSFPTWIQIARAGGKVSLRRSDDGSTYREVASRDIGNANSNQVRLDQDTLIGIAVTGGGGGSSLGAFRDVGGTPALPEFPEGTTAPTFRRGDVDASGGVDITDAVALLNSLFLGTGAPACLEAADFDNGGVLDISDAVTNLGYQFLGGSLPADPGPTNCGPDPAGPFLGCDKPCQ